MSGFLDEMASAERAGAWLEALRQESFAALEQRARIAPPAPSFCCRRAASM